MAGLGVQKTERVEELPAELYLEVTNRCNLKCKTCPQYFGMPEEFNDLTLGQVEEILDQIPVIKRVVLHGIGESIMNRELPEIVAATKRRGAYTLFNANGTIFPRSRVEGVVAAGLDELRISMDAASMDTYEEIRGEALFDKILENLEKLSEIKAKLKSETPHVSLWMTGLKTNIAELPELVRIAARVGVQEVYLQRLVTSDRGLARKDLTLYSKDRSEADEKSEQEFIEEAEQLGRQLGVQLLGSGSVTASDSVRRDFSEAPWRACRRPWKLMYITAQGNVLPCCIAPFTVTPYEDLVLGNVFEQTLAEVWNGPAYLSWRGRMLEGEPPQPCAGCGVEWSL